MIGWLDLSVEAFWLIGFIISTFGLIFQVLIYFLIPCSRKLDQKLLTQLTVARILNVVFEFLVLDVEMPEPTIRDPVFAFYVHTDAVLICWMFIFTKNLYDKVINVFTQKSSFTILSVTIWIAMFPIGLLCTVLLNLQNRNPAGPKYFLNFYRVYGIIKFVVLAVNLLLFFKIFSVALTRSSDRRNGIIRTCVVSFILVSIASLQVFLTDLLSFFCDEMPNVVIAFVVINSYQVVAITTIFVILVNGVCEESLSKMITKKFIKETV